MIDDSGHAVLMDFGSATKARIHIVNRQQALTQQVRFHPRIVFYLFTSGTEAQRS